ncbi:FkbM family methyltransferase [Selenomonas ruminantium]|uniref:FkbM family methyltransferase n=1 Tax=Selenomonas ruminantium TaxID=971 RepID=UPI00047B58DD|nr:FkbM family methyltransferase [Selenomonas ruminantium]
MKARVVIWDIDGYGKKWINENMHLDRLEIVQIIPPYEKNVRLIDDEIDLLLISKRIRDFDLQKMLEKVGFFKDRVVFIYSIESWYENFDQAMFLLRDNVGSMRRLLLWRQECAWKEYCTCKVDDITFVASVTDCVIMPYMYRDGQTWSTDEMKLFYKLAHEFYILRDDEEGYFLDLGANIGTTSIYFRKKLDENIKIIAFEPAVRNNRLLKINIEINELADESRIESYGLSNRSERKVLYYDEENPGGSSLLKNSGGHAVEVSLISLDDYFFGNNLETGKIKYIWIDTEGFEPLVVSGAKNILKNNEIPLYMELNPYLWGEYGFFDDVLICLRECEYKGYILIQEYMKGNKTVYPLDSLQIFRQSSKDFQSDIFLIK